MSVYPNYKSLKKRKQNDQIMSILTFCFQLFLLSVVPTPKFTSSYSAFILNKHSTITNHRTASKVFLSQIRKKTNKRGMIHKCVNDSSSSIPIIDLKKSKNPFSSKIKNQIVRFNDKINQHPTSRLDLNLLLIDNFDSYTYNLYQYFAEICHNPPIVITNDEFDKYKAIQKEKVLDGIIISPGPGNPINPIDVGVCKKAILENPNLPILGVCLGHQLLGHVYNATVHVAPTPMHGIICNMHHEDKSFFRINNKKNIHLFQDIPKRFNATRYHSLIVTIPSNNSDLIPIAWSQSNMNKEITKLSPNIDMDKTIDNKSNECIMALRHKKHPHWGVQFHPESVGTDPFGRTMIKNFCTIANQWKLCQNDSSKINFKENKISITKQQYPTFIQTNHNKETYRTKVQNRNKQASKFSVIIHHIETNVNLCNDYAQNIFESIYEKEHCSFWLDSSSSSPSCPQKSRFSIMGANNGPYSNIIEYYGKEDHSSKQYGLYLDGKQLFNPNKGTILDYLRNEMLDRMTDDVRMIQFSNDKVQFFKNEIENIPFEYRGGYVGYLGYEVRHDTSPTPPQRDPSIAQNFERKKANCNIPTAAFMFADRSIVVDHITGDVYIIGLVKQHEIDEVPPNNMASNPTFIWMEEISKQIQQISKFLQENNVSESIQNISNISFQPSRSKATYKNDITRCHDEIRKGESYELCLINQLKAHVTKNKTKHSSDLNPFGLYKILRKRNPAPYAAFMKFDTKNKFIQNNDTDEQKVNGSVAICCSSPERFLSIKKNQNIKKLDGNNEYFEIESKPIKGTTPRIPISKVTRPQFEIESKPIKGTCRRENTDKLSENVHTINDINAQELQSSIKNRAENLMIVDLLRNDMNRICKVGSVHVPHLMEIESYATVHQLVSTIRGELMDGCNAVDALKACFPGGSMTGAPKVRTMQILDEDMEQGAVRGPYSGSLGYFSLNGCMDMNIIIRTAVLTPSTNLDENKDLGLDISIGAGGAITALSESEDEYDEMLLKARAVVEAVNHWGECMGLEDSKNYESKKM